MLAAPAVSAAACAKRAAAAAAGKGWQQAAPRKVDLISKVLSRASLRPEAVAVAPQVRALNKRFVCLKPVG